MILSVVSMLSVIILATSGLDPVTQIYVWGATLGTLGYMTVLGLSSLAVLVFFKKSGVDNRIWNTFICPLLAMVGILGCLWVAFSNLPMLVGGDNGGEVVPVMGSLLVVFFAIGISVALRLKSREPERYNALLDMT